MTHYTIGAGQTSSGILLSANDSLAVTSGGTAVATTILSGGSATVSPDGISLDTIVNSGGEQIVYLGTASGSVLNLGGDEFVVAGVTSESNVASGGVENILASGTAIGAIVDSGGFVIVGSGNASGTVVSGGGYLVALPGSVVSNSAIESGGSVISTGVVADTVESGGHYYGASANGIAVGVNDELYILSAGTGNGVVLEDGSLSLGILGGAEFVYGIASGTMLGTLTSEFVESGGTEIDAVARAPSARINIFDGGTAIGTTVSSGSYENIQFGGVGSGSIVHSGGTEAVNGTSYDDIISFGGYANVGRSAESISATISSGGIESVSRLGKIIGTTIAASGTLILYSSAVTDGGIAFTGTGGYLVVSDTTMPTTDISGFTAGDEIDLAQVPYGSGGTVVFDSSTDVLTVTEAGSSYSLHFAGDYESAVFHLGADVDSGSTVTVTNVPCFAAGTRILTEKGEVAVERIALDDCLMTESGKWLPVIWIGTRRVDCRRHPAPTKILPVLIMAGAFGPGCPRRDLFLSPDHAIHAEEVLIPIKYLINGKTIRQVDVACVDYFHIELTQHSVILAEGLPVETYLNTGDRNNFANAEAAITLHPVFGVEDWQDAALMTDALAYAPLRVTGPEVERVRAGLNAWTVDNVSSLPAQRGTPL